MASELESVFKNIKIVVFIIASVSLLSGEAVPTRRSRGASHVLRKGRVTRAPRSPEKRKKKKTNIKNE